MTTPLGKYKLVKLIASGGMAEVYLAKQAGAAGFEKLVCLKRILPHLARDKAFVEMFLNEARLAARLDHPNIVSIFDLGEASGNFFIAMEFIDGPSLRAVHKVAESRGEKLPIPEICKIVSMAAGGLQYAHDLADQDGRPLGLVHRDISPDNILVHKNGSAKVVDFGIAKAANSSSQTRTGTLKGKVAYMPPEQLRGEALDRRTDIFALGVVLYELVAGKRPWEGTSDVALIGKIMTEEPVPLQQLRPEAPPALFAIVDKALAKERSLRYQSCHEMQADLEALVVQLGRTLSPARISDFVKAYSPAAQHDATSLDNSAAEMQHVEDELNGTGSAPPLVKGRPKAPVREPRTMMLPPQPRAGSSRGLWSGVLAFVVIAVSGGLGGYWYFFHREPPRGPVVIERAGVGDADAAAAAAKEAAAKEAAAKEAAEKEAAAKEAAAKEAAAKEAAEKEAAAKEAAAKEAAAKEAAEKDAAAKEAARQARQRARRAAQAEEPEPVVVVVKEPAPPEPPKATVVAKGELVLLIRPWARVEVDGRDVGTTPLDEPLILAAGDHKVRLINTELQKDVMRTVHITASEKEVLKAILDE